MKRAVALSLLLAMTVGCYRATIRSPNEGVEGEPISSIGFSFLWGITPVETAAACRGAIAKTEVVFPWWAPIVMGITGGIVAPMKVSYWCAERRGGRQNQPPAQ